MKKNEIALILLIAGLTVGIAYAIGSSLLGKTPASKEVSVPTIEAISTSVTEPEERTFNQQAINPTVRIDIGETDNQQPF